MGGRRKSLNSPAADQRIRDPIHDLILFARDNELDQLAWRLLDCREFQRLRRIRQLGFSDLVFPGATHSRFAHCVGVFHTARDLLGVLQRELGPKYDQGRVAATVCAALLHDIGHGPFSHAFERAAAQAGVKKKHEKWTAEIVTGDTQVRAVLEGFDPKLPEAVREIIIADEPRDVFATLVTSQFDADRLDYLRRDRYMTGVSVGNFDYRWILSNLRVTEIVASSESIGPVADKAPKALGLALDPKAIEAAEGYLLARHQLYSSVYFHKTTRAAEVMLLALLSRLARAAAEGRASGSGLPNSHPLAGFLAPGGATLAAYLRLDDSMIWSAIDAAAQGGDPMAANLAQRLLNRNLFKPFDLSREAREPGDRIEHFVSELPAMAKKLGLDPATDVIIDRPALSGYGLLDWRSPAMMKKLLVVDPVNGFNLDIHECSAIVRDLAAASFLRVYLPDESARDKVRQLWNKFTKRRQP